MPARDRQIRQITENLPIYSVISSIGSLLCLALLVEDLPSAAPPVELLWEISVNVPSREYRKIIKYDPRLFLPGITRAHQISCRVCTS